MLSLHEQDYCTIIRFKSIQMDISKSCYHEAQTSKKGSKDPSDLNRDCKFERNHERLNTIHLKCMRDHFNNEQPQPVVAPFFYTSRRAIKAMKRIKGSHKDYKQSHQANYQQQSTTVIEKLLVIQNMH